MSADHMTDIAGLLARVRDGDARARIALFPLVYAELEAIARAYLRGPELSIEPQDLVHELYLRLCGGALAVRDQHHFYAVAALAMRQILADRARRRRTAKRSRGPADPVVLAGLAGARTVDVIAVDDALRRLEALSPRQARVVELRSLLGMSAMQTAHALGVSERTVREEWRTARAWLVRELGS